MKQISILLIIAFLGYSCECTDVEPTEAPYLNTFVVQNIAGQISNDPVSCSVVFRMDIIFNKPVDGSTIDFTEKVLLTGYSGGNLSFSTDGKTLSVLIEDFSCQDGFCVLGLNIASGVGKGILSQSGDILDGNRDGTAGDDFNTVMTLY